MIKLQGIYLIITMTQLCTKSSSTNAMHQVYPNAIAMHLLSQLHPCMLNNLHLNH